MSEHTHYMEPYVLGTGIRRPLCGAGIVFTSHRDHVSCPCCLQMLEVHQNLKQWQLIERIDEAIEGKEADDLILNLPLLKLQWQRIRFILRHDLRVREGWEPSIAVMEAHRALDEALQEGKRTKAEVIARVDEILGLVLEDDQC